jgi:trehalose 6-phosphate synthase
VSVTIVANRLPVERTEAGWAVSPGGLVTALRPVLAERGGTWVGWAGEVGDPEHELPDFTAEDVHMAPVALDETDLADYYEGFSNSSLWPLYHDRIRPPTFHRHWWRRYVAVNRRFAVTAARHSPQGGAVWVHDYHLSLVPRMLREMRPDLRIGFFLHIPFPPLELFAQLPWRVGLLRGMLGADAIGFQTQGGARIFRRTARHFLDVRLDGRNVRLADRHVRVEAQPIAIDTGDFIAAAKSNAVDARVAELRAQMGGRKVLLGVDRLDYTKGIRTRLRAFEALLDRDPSWAERAVFVQVAVPSRANIGLYREMRESIEGAIGRINGRFSSAGVVPVHYFYSSLDRDELLAHYRMADVMVVTPPRDGMNLVAMEFCACRIEDDGVLILSEFAGAARQLRRALHINPYDLDGITDAYEQALNMPLAEQRRHMRPMRALLRRRDVHVWARQALAAFAADPVS